MADLFNDITEATPQEAAQGVFPIGLDDDPDVWRRVTFAALRRYLNIPANSVADIREVVNFPNPSTLAEFDEDIVITLADGSTRTISPSNTLKDLVIAALQDVGGNVPEATESATGTVTLAREEDVADSETDLSRVGTIARIITLIQRLIGENVRSIPEAEASHVGRPLVATSSRRPWVAYQRLGTDGYDDNSITEAKLDADARGKLNRTGGTTDYNDLANKPVLVDVPASSDTEDTIIIEDSQLYTTRNVVVHEATPKRATFNDQLRPNRQFIGFFFDEAALDPTFYAAGRWYYSLSKNTERVNRYITGNSGPKHWVDGTYADLVAGDGVNVGHYPSDEEATPYVNRVGDVYVNDRSREYRQVATFTAGSGPVTQPQRFRQANEDDLERVDAELRDSIGFVLQASPQYVDIGNRPDRFLLTLTSRPRQYRNATKVRLRFLEVTGDTPDLATFIEFPFDPLTSQQSFQFLLSPLQQQRLATFGPGGLLPLTCEIRAADDDILDEVYINIGTQRSLTVRNRTAVNAVEDLEDRAADLRVVTPPQWSTASGTGVGISLTTALVADPSSLSFNPMVDIPSDAVAGDDYILYMAIPTGSNLSDYRVNLDGFAEYTGASFGEVATDGDNTIYSFNLTVGNGSGGFASGTAPGATLTLQFHGSTYHTAFGGELEGHALAQVRSEGGGTPPRLITGSGGVFTLTDNENIIHVEVSNATGRLYGRDIMRADLTTTAKRYIIDTRNPAQSDTDNFNTMLGVNVSLSGNNLTVNTTGFINSGALVGVWGIVSGAEGPRGAQGPAGAAGAQGPQGDRGPKGDQGDQGDQGDRGEQGATGPQGSQGDRGPQGSQGDRGPTGPQGPTGPAGPKGDKGDQGDRGPVGPGGASRTFGTSAGNIAPWVEGNNTDPVPANKFSKIHQIGLLKFTPFAPIFNYRSSRDFIRNFQVLVDNPELLTGDVWIQRFVGGRAVPGARIKWTSTTNSIDFPSTNAAVDSVLTNQQYPLSIWFYDAATGGNILDTVRINIGLTNIDSAFTLNSAASINFDVDNSTKGTRATGILRLAADATLNITGGRDGSTALVQIVQAPRPGGGWRLTLHSSVQRFNNVAAPVLKTADGAIDLLEFQRIGTVWYYIGRADVPDFNAINGVTDGSVTQIDNARVTGFQGVSLWLGTKAEFNAIRNKATDFLYGYPEE